MTIHTFQIHDSELSAFKDMLFDAIHQAKTNIQDNRLSIDFDDTTNAIGQLSSIQHNEGRLSIYQDLLDQIDNPY